MPDHRAIICLGSNVPSKERKVSDAIAALSSSRLITVASQSDCIMSPDDTGLGDIYTNTVIELHTTLKIDALRQKLKLMETAAGRNPQSKATGVMPLDIDIIIWDDKVIDDTQAAKPYFVQAYRQIQK